MHPKASGLPRVEKWLLCIDLKIGVLIWTCFELGIWAFLSYAAVDNESAFFSNYDLYKYEEHIEDNWYFQMIFGQPEEDDYDYEMGYESVIDDTDGIDEGYRFQTMAINGILMFVFIAYFILTVFFILAIVKRSMNFAIPYIIFDSFIIWMSLISIFAALFNMNFVMVRNCSIFASIKFYPAICNYSYFRDVGGKFTFSRDIPQFLRNSPKTFERRSQYAERRRISKMKEKRETENVHELQVLKPKEKFEGKKQEILEVVVTR
ncbi:unnamed protein product [Chironomus riparius]|uniref:Uncharacterized protein n=1 Tax=Chironomus riparius TaxID=315576 RepID=A0A9N9S858_9DIPT|nr:unnamed protein product [Chironomus riparius]